MSAPTLDSAVIQGELKEVKKVLGELCERVARLETNFGVSETGLSLIYSALEAAGIMKNGEPTTTAKPEPTRETWDPSKIMWIIARGSKGEYERSEDVSNIEFKKMLKDLAAHKGKLYRNGLFYWTFQSGAVVGRKKRS